MKKIILALIVLCSSGFLYAQTAFSGKGDVKLNIGLDAQSKGTGIAATMDYGLGESFSVGIQAGYLLGLTKYTLEDPSFGDRFDAKLRFNANIGNAIGLPENIDVYPGLNLGIRNFGGHLGARYFFPKGFGLYTEIQFPIAKYSDKDKIYHNLNNQFAFHIGASFDLTK